MDSILDRIYQAHIEMLRNNQNPTTVYLGADDYSQLLYEARGNGAVTMPLLTAEGRTRVFNMELYAVDARNHLRVV